jgi:hypothetical protein
MKCENGSVTFALFRPFSRAKNWRNEKDMLSFELMGVNVKLVCDFVAA